MTIHRSDHEQAARYLGYACVLLERQAAGKTVALRKLLLDVATRRRSPGGHYVGNAAADIIALRQVAEMLPFVDARMEILKAIAVLRARVER